MNNSQKLWWQQAKSDFDIFELMLEQGVADCHKLHYLQMATEKLAKAFLWKLEAAPAKSHVGFVKYLKLLVGSAPKSERERLAQLFSFPNFVSLQSWIKYSICPITYDLERITPDLANDGPNPEYPWPHINPVETPVNHRFAVWKSLQQSKGRELMRFIGTAIDRFPEFATL